VNILDAKTLWDLAELRAEATPDAIFSLDEAGEELSFEGLRRQALVAAAGLHECGLRQDDVVSWILPTRISAFVLMVALSRLGVVQSPLLPIYRQREAEFCLRQTQARWLLVPGVFRGVDYGEMARDLTKVLPDLQTLGIDAGLPQGDPEGLPAAPVGDFSDAAPVRWIFYTSGTTSDPKGALHTERAILLSSLGMVEAVGFGPGDRMAVVFPVTHLGGANSLVASLATGATQLVVERFDPPSTIPFLASHGVTHAGAGPVFYQAYLEAQRAEGPDPIFPGLKVLYGGGAPLPPQRDLEVRREMGGVGVLSTYGMTECPIISMVRRDDSDERRAGTVGRPTRAETRIRVVRSDGSEAAPGEEGELRVHGLQLLKGFVDERLDAQAFDDQGFFRTGDLGRVDAAGYVVITGRMKDIIIRKGENISALEIENLLDEHPKVAEVSVIGLPDEERGELCCAVVRDVDPADPLEFDEMVAFLETRQLMRQKIPERLEHLAELPVNPSGKVVKPRLQERFS